MNIGEKNIIKKARKKSIKKLKEDIRKECLLVALAMIKEGETRKSDEAIRVYMRLEERKNGKKEI